MASGAFIHGLYETFEALHSEERRQGIYNVIEEMVKKYPDKEVSYIFKALFYFKTGNNELFEENVDIALKINSDIVKRRRIK